ncbi:hypothetical protein F444_15379 [Phytophthora nicotianae P1976]|uniref:FLYWCH-type domain-containing protein n=1 Tax=Phytophthora nicotianae P1976 TaxID=1317066 RepID=A0A080ZM59_PHYNI|nr:hypothetical protein F444_15379 [Phytophthora nicotianae P1976]
MQHDDHYYYYKDSYKTTKYYACRQSQTTKCKARLTCHDDGTVHIKGDHVCVTGDDVIARDVQEEMRQLLELQSLGRDDPHKTVNGLAFGSSPSKKRLALSGDAEMRQPVVMPFERSRRSKSDAYLMMTRENFSR